MGGRANEIPPRGQRVGPPPIEDTSEEGRGWGEVQAGLRCAGCGERIRNGFEFKRVRVYRPALDIKGERVAAKSSTYACASPTCDYALRCAAGATAVRVIRNEWMFMDDERIAKMFPKDPPEDLSVPIRGEEEADSDG